MVFIQKVSQAQRTDPGLYDSLDQVPSGRSFWQDGTPVARQQFDYSFDTMGNRKTASMGGDSNGGGLRTAAFTTDRPNRYAHRTVPGYAGVLGIANPNSSLRASGNMAYRHATFQLTLPPLQPRQSRQENP